MKIDEFILSEDSLYEMSNFNHRTTGLPPNIELWVRTDLGDHGHNRYRVKIVKNREWSSIFTVSALPEKVKELPKNQLSASEEKEVMKFIETYSSLIISLVDGKIDSAEFSIELKKLRGEK